MYSVLRVGLFAYECNCGVCVLFGFALGLCLCVVMSFLADILIMSLVWFIWWWVGFCRLFVCGLAVLWIVGYELF